LAYKRIICDPYNQRYIGRYYWDNTPGTQDHVFRPPRLLKPSAKWAQDLSLPQEPYIVLNPCSAWRRKCYPVDRWLEIVQKLSEMGFAKKIVLLGGQESWHAEFNNQIASHPAVINLTGQTNLRQYIYTISRASLILTVDGSASHLAQAFERPCLTLFGASYEHRWHYPEPYHEMLSSRSYAPTEDRPPAEKIDQKDVLRIMENMVSDCKSL
jgi:ADP-heptose:LPS heptosyltransferase